MFSHSIGGSTHTQSRRQASARHPQMQVTTAANTGPADNRTASHSASRQQQSGSNLHLIPRAPVTGGVTSNTKKMKLIRTRAPGNGSVANEKKSRLKSPNNGNSAGGPTIDTRNSRVRQQNLNLSSNQFLKSPTTASAPHTTKNQPSAASYRQQSMQDQFIFSASSPPVQINKQAIMMNAQQAQQPARPIQGKQKESLGHITASRRQKQTGLQINVDGCQSIVINSPSRGHVIASPAAKAGAPDNMLFYGTNQQPKQTMSPTGVQAHQASSHLDSLNQMSPKGGVAHYDSQQQQPRSRQQQSSMSKKLLRQKVVTQEQNNYEQRKNHQNLQIGGTSSKVGQGTYQITPKNASHQFDQIHGPQIGSSGAGGPRSTKARSSQHYAKGRFIEPSKADKHQQQQQQYESQQQNGPQSPTNQPTMSTLEQQRQQQQQQKQQQMQQRGFSPRRDQQHIENAADEAAQMLFMQSPPPAVRRGSNRLMSPGYNVRASAHSSYNNRGKQHQSAKTGPKQHHSSTNNNNSSLGLKKTNAGATSNQLKISNMRVYNESSGMVGSNHNSQIAPASTKHETTQQRYAAMRNNFISPGMIDKGGRPVGSFNAPDRKEQMARHTGGGSNLRHFQNQSNSSNTVNNQSYSGVVSKGNQSKKRKLTLNQRSTNNGSLNSSGIMQGTSKTTNSTMRPLSGAVKGAGTRGQQSYSLKQNVAYVSALHGNDVQPQQMNIISQRQSTTGNSGKNIQILATETDQSAGQRVYSPNAAMNGRRDINQEIQNLSVPQFYPQTATNASAPRQIQFNQTANVALAGATGQEAGSMMMVSSGSTHIQQKTQQRQQQLNEISSACLMDEPMIVAAGQAQSATGQSQAIATQNLISSSNSSIEQHSQLLQQQKNNQALLQQQNFDQSQQQSNASYMAGSSQIICPNQILQEERSNHQSQHQHHNTHQQQIQTTNDNHSNNHSRQSLNSHQLQHNLSQHQQPQEIISPRHPQQNTGTNKQQHKLNIMKPQELQQQQQHDISGPLVIPNFSVNLPQTTTGANSNKISNGDALLSALDPISKNSKDINQKIQQRKIESSRRLATDSQQQQTQDTVLTKQNSSSHNNVNNNNLQVVVTHDLNPVVSLANTTGYKQAQTTTNNANNGKVIPNLNFTQQPQQQQSTQNLQQKVQSQRLSSQKTASRNHQQRIHSHHSTARSNAASSHRDGGNESYNSKGQSSKQRQQQHTSTNRSSKQASPSKNRQNQQPKSTMQLNQSSVQGSRTQLTSDQQSKTTSSKQPTRDQSSSSNPYNQQIKYPITPAKCLKVFGTRHLTDYEKTEILDFPQVYYFGEGVKKIQAQRPTQNQSSSKFNRDSSKNRNNSNVSDEQDTNCGYDDTKGNYRVVMKDQIAYRYEMVEHLGRGSFGVAIKCFDHKTQEFVAIKIIKNKQKYYYQAGVELKILQYLKDNDPDDTMNIIHMKDYVIFRKHLCITFELMSINLYEFLKLNDFEGLSLSLVRRFAIQLLYSLKFLKENDVIHCDLKPENILLKDPSKSGIKIIDFGSSCFQDERVYTYIQSRFYRAPEIILGIPYTPCIDMWSFGCIMAEFAMGYPIFPGEDETDQISLIMEVCGIPASEVLAKGQRKTKFFNESNMPKMVPNSHGKVRKPGTKVLDDILECSDQSFVNFVERCLEWDPEKRMTPDEAIRHQWILEGLPPKVLVHHQKLHNIATRSLPSHIREQRAEYLSTQPLEVQNEFQEDDEEQTESESMTINSSANNYQPHKNKQSHQPKSKSLDRQSQFTATASQQQNGQQQQAGNNPLSVRNQRYNGNAQNNNNNNQGSTRHRSSQSYDQTSGYKHTNVSANVNSQQHHNLRQKKQVGVLKSSAAGGDTKQTVEQMLHASQR